MSEAFDTINHNKLVHILSDIVIEDELKIIRFLQYCDQHEYQWNNQHHSFTANTDTPQGNGLSLVTFIAYLENALRNVLLQPEHKVIPQEVAYADDVDFVSQ